jgi:hypothetical protein
MATVQQLEKLHQIQVCLHCMLHALIAITRYVWQQRLFYVEDSLESAVAGERVVQLIARTEQVRTPVVALHMCIIRVCVQLLRQRAFLRDERRRLRIATEKVEERKNALTIMQRADWLPEALKSVDTDKHILINVGGLVRACR